MLLKEGWKKLISIIVAALTLSMNFTSVYAADSNNQSSNSNIDLQLLSSEVPTVKKFVNFLDKSGDADASQYLLGNRIPSYKWDGESFFDDETAYYYPVYGDGKIVGIYTLIDPLSNGPGATFGVDFSQQFQSVIDNGCTEYFLVHYDNQTFVYGDKSATQIAEFQFSPVPEERESDEPSKDAEIIAPKPKTPSSTKSKSKDYSVKTEGLSENDLSDSIAESNFKFAYNTDLKETQVLRSDNKFVDVSPTNTARASDFTWSQSLVLIA